MEPGSTKATIQAEDWPEPMDASPEVIRATVYSGSMSFFRFKIVRPDGWELWGIHYEKKGWNIRTGRTRPLYELSAVRFGSKYAGKPISFSLIGRFFNRFEYFDEADVERVAAEFLEGASPPTLVDWVEVSRD